MVESKLSLMHDKLEYRKDVSLVEHDFDPPQTHTYDFERVIDNVNGLFFALYT